MRANGFKKALILAAAAFVTAVIGIGGAKLKVQAAPTTYIIHHNFAGTEPAIGAHINAGDIFTNADTEPGGNEITAHLYFYDTDGITEFTTLSIHNGGSTYDLTIPDTTNLAYWEIIDKTEVTGTGGNFTYKFKKVLGYDVTYENWDGTELQKTRVVSGAATPDYTGAPPTKAPSGGYTYAWNTVTPWTPAVATNVTADATYVANFTGTLTNYTITWKNDDGTTLKTDTVAAGDLPSYGGTPSKPDDENYTYTFSMWSPTVQLATTDATYTAVYLQDPKPATGGGSEPDSSSSSGDGSGSGSGDGSSTTGTDGSTTGNRAPKTADTMPGIIVIALAGLLGGALLITGGRKFSK